MSNEEIAWQLYDELQHNRIINYEQYSNRLNELLRLAHPNEEKIDGYGGEAENIMHDKWSFGFCDMCGEVIFYDDDPWYDLAMCEPEEQEVLEETLPKWQNETGNMIQDVCPTCFAKLLKKGDEAMLNQDVMEMTICDHYYNIVKGLADKVIKHDGIYDDEKYFQAIDDSLNKEDDAYIVANALEKGIISWGHNVNWDAVNEMLYSDIMEEIRKIKGE